MSRPPISLTHLCAALSRKYQTIYEWRTIPDQARWIFVPHDGSQPMWTVAMVDLVRTRCVNVETLLGFLHPFVFPVIPTPLPPCRQCGTKGLEHFYTSKRDQTILCPACFADRESQHLAKESIAPERQEEIALSSPPA